MTVFNGLNFKTKKRGPNIIDPGPSTYEYIQVLRDRVRELEEEVAALKEKLEPCRFHDVAEYYREEEGE